MGGDGAVEIASVNSLGTRTAAAFKIEYATGDSQGKAVKKQPFQTSFSLTCRSLAASLCAHGDDKGFILPPRLALLQVVILPLANSNSWKAKGKGPEDASITDLTRWCEMLASHLGRGEDGEQALRTKVDSRRDGNLS